MFTSVKALKKEKKEKGAMWYKEKKELCDKKKIKDRTMWQKEN